MFERPILITGGAGFIGSHLTDALLARGYRVRVLDNLSTGKRDNLPLDDERVELLEGDAADAATLAAALKGCAAVAHLAAVASVQASVDDPVATHQSNFIATLNLCEAMREQGVKRVVFASSAAVYGQNGEGTAIDEDTPKSPLTPYASDKLASEYYLDFYRRQHGLEPAIFRFFNVYGPRQDPSSPYSGVISIFTERALGDADHRVRRRRADPRLHLRRRPGRFPGPGAGGDGGGTRGGERRPESQHQPEAVAGGDRPGARWPAAGDPRRRASR